MNDNVLRQTSDTLETFLLLKQQNLLIYAWMELKKRSRRAASIHGNRSIYHASSSRGSVRANLYGNLNSNFQSATNTPHQLTPTKSYNRITPRISRKNIRLATENQLPNQAEGFTTFQKEEGDRCNQTEHYTARNYPFRQMHPQNQEADMEDSDEFQDIVLDRLSKLEENINRLMREKKQKEQKRGYVGAPLTNPYGATPLSNSQFQRSPFINYQPSQDDQYLQEENPKNTFANIHQRKQKFFESLQHNKLDNNSMIYNVKYIPVERQPQTSIQRIRNIIQSKQDEDIFIDNLDYFVANNPRRQQELKNNIDVHQDEFLGQQNKVTPRPRNSTSLYIHRNGIARDPRVHYTPRNIQMQTVIGPPTKRYFHREGHGTNPHIQAEDELKKSRASRHTQYSGKGNNLSAYY